MYLLEKLFDLLSPPVAPVKVNPIAQRLLDAAQRIRERGWTQGVACNEVGELCLVGAIYNVRVPAQDIPGWYIADPLGSDATGVMISLNRGAPWNDAPGRTAAEVIAALESVAAELQVNAGV